MKTVAVAVVAVLALAITTRAHAQGAPLVIAWQAPVGPNGPNPNNTPCDPVVLQNCFNCPSGSTEFACFINKVLPNISGIGFTVPWGEIDKCGSPAQSTPCVSDATCGTSNCYKWSWVDNALNDFTSSLVIGGSNSWANGCAGGRPCKIVLIITLTSDSGNANLYNNAIPNTPIYVFTQDYANKIGSCPPYGMNTSCAAQDVVICQQRQGTNGLAGGGAWGATAPISDSCWGGGPSNDFGLWNEGKRVVLRTVGSCMQFAPTVPSPPFTNHSGYPVMYEKPILTAAENFLSALALHYSQACTYSSCGLGPSLAKSMAYMRIGPSSGGENFPYCACQSSTGATQCDPPSPSYTYWPGPKGYDLEPNAYTDRGYLTSWANGDGMGYVASLYSFIHSLNWNFPISTPTEHGPPANLNYTYPDIEASLANQYGLGMGMQAASVGDLVTAAAQSFPSTVENWGVHFREFPNVPVHHLQTMIPGNTSTGSPSHAAQFSITSIGSPYSPGELYCSSGDCSIFCNSPWVFISGTSNPVFNGIWETAAGTNPPSPTGCSPNTIQLLAPYPSGVSNNGYVYSPAHLPILLPFETQQCRGSFETICSAELWEETLDWTYGTNTTSFSSGNPPLGDSAYQVAIQNFLAGLPSATSFHNHMSTNANHY